MGRVDRLDSPAVFGLFIGRFDDVVDWNRRSHTNVCGEIDIEFSRWGNPRSQNTQFLPQPYQAQNTYRFNMALTGDWSRHEFLWTPQDITFVSRHDHHHYPVLDNRLLISRWHYTGEHNPRPLGQRVWMNLWLHEGRAPRGDGIPEVGIKSFQYTPLGTPESIKFG